MSAFGVINNKKIVDDAAYMQRQMTEETQMHMDSIVTKPIENLRTFSSDSAPRSAPRMIKPRHLTENAQTRQNPYYLNLNEELYNGPSGNVAVRRVSLPEYNYKAQFSAGHQTHRSLREFDDHEQMAHYQRMTKYNTLEHLRSAPKHKKQQKYMSYGQIMED